MQLPGQDAAAPLAVQRAAYARALGLPALLDLMARVDTAHQQVLLPAARSPLPMTSAETADLGRQPWRLCFIRGT